MKFLGTVATIPPVEKPEYYRLSVDQVVRTWHTSLVRGLSADHVRKQEALWGPNTIQRRELHLLRALGRRVSGLLTLLLLAATGISLTLGEYADALIIGVVVVVDILLGLLYESYAQYRLELIRKQVPRVAEVLRDGRRELVPAEVLVPGDLVTLRAGERVPADLRLAKIRGLRVDESVLTGEAGDMEKTTVALEAPTAIADQRNMVFAGTLVTTGAAEGIVTATGPRSVLGSLARRVVAAGWQATPLEHKLRGLGQAVGVGVLFAAALLYTLGVLRGYPTKEMFRSALTLTVAAIPEDLMLILTIALAVGATRLLRHRTVVRHLAASETLGDVTVVATDKTGTLTTGRMKLLRIENVTEQWGSTTFDDARTQPAFQYILTAATAGIEEDTEQRGPVLERALSETARQAGLSPSELRRLYRPYATLAFDARARYRASLHDDPRSPEPILFVVGAPEVLLPKCTKAMESDKPWPFSPAARTHWLALVADAAGIGTRIVAVCARHLPRAARTLTPEDVDHLSFVALLHFEDPLRPDAAAAVRGLREAGVRTLLLTGDHRGTAEAVGRAIHILRADRLVLDGMTVDRLSDALLEDQASAADVLARVDPFQKERVVAALQRRGETVAMLGDGVNDAVALRRADIGVVVANATDVAKDAADLVLLDGGLIALTAAVREGRRIRETVRTVLAFLFSTNITEVLAVAVALVFGLPLPFLPAQLLWINVVTDGTADVALALEPARTRPGDAAPARQRSLFRADDLLGMAWTAVAVLIPVLGVYTVGLSQGVALREIRTMAFAIFVTAQVLAAFSFRSLQTSAFRLGPWGNPWLVLSTALSLALLVAGIHWPPLATLLGTSPLSPAAWLVVGIASVLAFLGVELRKPIIRALLHGRTHPLFLPAETRAPAG